MTSVLEPHLPPFNNDAAFVRTQPPNPEYKFGDRLSATEEGRRWLEGEKMGWKTFDTSKESAKDLYPLLLSGVYPRPVAFVSSVTEDGVENLAPFRFAQFFLLSPTVCLRTQGSSYFNTVSSVSLFCVARLTIESGIRPSTDNLYLCEHNKCC
ncbi:hypothetical protein PM082_016372 [Marasmius tenuissimus]|nr:hypothetical protein PM082_016372 [Marasmius tenuissimus]